MKPLVKSHSYCLTGILTRLLKKAKPGDFRVQDDYGGTVHNYVPNVEEINFAETAVKACPEIPVYARVILLQIITDNLFL